MKHESRWSDFGMVHVVTGNNGIGESTLVRLSCQVSARASYSGGDLRVLQPGSLPAGLVARPRLGVAVPVATHVLVVHAFIPLA